METEIPRSTRQSVIYPQRITNDLNWFSTWAPAVRNIYLSDLGITLRWACNLRPFDILRLMICQVNASETLVPTNQSTWHHLKEVLYFCCVILLTRINILCYVLTRYSNNFRLATESISFRANSKQNSEILLTTMSKHTMVMNTFLNITPPAKRSSN
jgi:hypothetical protein